MKKDKTGTRKDNGAGHISLLPDGRWVARISIGRGSDGRTKVKALYGSSEAEVKRKLKDFKKELYKNDEIVVKNGTVQDYMENWLYSNRKNALKPSSFDRLEVTLKYSVFPYIGRIQLGALSSADIQKMINTLRDNSVSYSTLKKAYDAVHSCFALGVLQKSVRFNPAIGVSLPPADYKGEKTLKFFQPDEVARLYKVAKIDYAIGTKSYRLAPIVIFDLNTGLRIGELIALRWDDVDFEERCVHVWRNSVVVKNRDKDIEKKYIALEQSRPKSKAGVRDLYLNDDAYEALKRLHKITGKFDYVLATQKGTPVSARNLQAMFTSIEKAAGLPEDRQYGFHALRHTFASLLFASGENVKTVSVLLGHSDTTITYNTYIHLVEGQKKKALTHIKDFIGSQINPKDQEIKE